MSSPATEDELDYILGLQISVAWAGEQGGEPPRLGWWKTDLVDDVAGGDLFRRLLPRTVAWAGYQAVREAAIRKDKELRHKLGTPDEARTLFHFGFAVDEQLHERLAHHKRHGHEPADVLGSALSLSDAWDPKVFEQFLEQRGSAKTEIVPGARKLKHAAATLREQAEQLAAALLPLSEAYPLPFLTVNTGG